MAPALAPSRRAGEVTASPYDRALSAFRSRVRDLAAWLATWQARQEPDAVARRHASDAVDAIDAMLADLHQVRAGWAQRALASLRWHWGTAYIISWPAPGTRLAQRRDTRETLRADSAEAH